MQVLTDGVIAFLSAVGLMTLLWLLTELLWSRQRRKIPLVLVLSVAGEAEDLAYMLYLTAEQRNRWSPDQPIRLVDCGLDADARQQAETLCRNLSGTKLTTPEELKKELKERGTQTWESAAR